jgi:hypothetical protein
MQSKQQAWQETRNSSAAHVLAYKSDGGAQTRYQHALLQRTCVSCASKGLSYRYLQATPQHNGRLVQKLVTAVANLLCFSKEFAASAQTSCIICIYYF